MSRLSPLIVRRVGPFLRASPRLGRRPALAGAMALPQADPFAGAEPARWLEDLRLFATGWVGGLIFFGTLFG